MATRAEQFRAEEERTARAKSTKNAASKRAGAKKGAKAHAEKKATYAREEQARPGQPTRKSTRGSMNRAKSDASLMITQEQERDAPTTRFRSSKEKNVRVKGKPAP